VRRRDQLLHEIGYCCRSGLATAVLVALQGGLLLAKVERDARPLATALDVMISLIASLAPTGVDDRKTETR
jgi:hypothetical protein